MRTKQSLAGGLAALALAAAALAACSPAGAPAQTAVDKNTDWVREQFRKAENDKSAMGELFKTMRESEPALYETFVATASKEISAGKSLFEAGAAARPVYLARFISLMKTATDKDTNELLAFSLQQMQQALSIDPGLCAALARGEADKRAASFPPAMIDREMRLMTQVIRSGQQNGPAATAEDVSAWTGAFVRDHPESVEGLQMMSLPAPTGDQAEKICKANILMIETLSAEEPATRARLFRGLLNMA